MVGVSEGKKVHAQVSVRVTGISTGQLTKKRILAFLLSRPREFKIP